MRKAASPVAVKIEARFPGTRLVGGKFSMAENRIYLYKEGIMRQCMRLFGSLEKLEDYAAVVLGHANDSELEELASRLDWDLSAAERAFVRLAIEENAWRYARTVLADLDPAFVEPIVSESLAGYRSAAGGSLTEDSQAAAS